MENLCIIITFIFLTIFHLNPEVKGQDDFMMDIVDLGEVIRDKRMTNSELSLPRSEIKPDKLGNLLGDDEKAKQDKDSEDRTKHMTNSQLNISRPEITSNIAKSIPKDENQIKLEEGMEEKSKHMTNLNLNVTITRPKPSKPDDGRRGTSNKGHGHSLDGDECTEDKDCIPTAKCQASKCVCKIDDAYGKECEITGKSFLGSMILPGGSDITGEAFRELQSSAERSLQALEKLMTLQPGESCDSSLQSKLDGDLNYFGNLSPGQMGEMSKHLASIEEIITSSENKTLCDYKEFLKCNNEEGQKQVCVFLVDGVVGKTPSGAKMVYQIGSGFSCSQDYPSIFDTKVEVRCIQNAEGSCSKTQPGLCSCKDGFKGVRCDENSGSESGSGGSGGGGTDVDGGRQEDNNDPSTPTTDTPGGNKFGESCTKDEDCSPDMICKSYKLTLTAKLDMEITDGREGEVVMEDYDQELEVQQNGNGDVDPNSMRAFAAGGDRRCQCERGKAPFDHWHCKKAYGEICDKDDECASENCVSAHCKLNEIGLLFVHSSTSEPPTPFSNQFMKIAFLLNIFYNIIHNFHTIFC